MFCLQGFLTLTIAFSNIVEHIEQTLSIEHYQTLSSIVKHCRTLCVGWRQWNLELFLYYCRTLSNIIEHYQTLSSIVIHCRTLSSIVKHCQALSNIIEHCQAFSNIVEHYQHCQTLWKIFEHFWSLPFGKTWSCYLVLSCSKNYTWWLL